ncbi:MAG: hypothetical protein EHM13_05780 [Acidobacteria bacterium]|nr:MAG: hypothetical protein EHM13_05780 [Acidobacteriota bacterium]
MKPRFAVLAIGAAALAAAPLPQPAALSAQSSTTIDARTLARSHSYALLAPAPSACQAAGATADPISGSWGADGKTFLELKFDGNGLVSGTTIWRIGEHVNRSEIKTGTFDPKTRALNLEGEAERPDNGEMAAYRIEGKLNDEGVLAGSYSFAGREGKFSFTRR